MHPFLRKIESKGRLNFLYENNIKGCIGGSRRVYSLVEYIENGTKPVHGRIFLFDGTWNTILLDIYTGNIATFSTTGPPFTSSLNNDTRTDEICSLITACFVQGGVGHKYTKCCALIRGKDDTIELKIGNTYMYIKEYDDYTRHQLQSIEIHLESGTVISCDEYDTACQSRFFTVYPAKSALI